MDNQVLVIGLDGMTWDVIKHASMPNFTKFVEEGGSGTLMSTSPPVTCPAWPSYLTGKDPFTHEVFDFALLDENDNVELNEYGNINSPTLIDVMDESDVPSIFFEIPMTYPAPDKSPITIAGYPASQSDKKFSRESLQSELIDKFGEFPSISPVKYSGKNRDEMLNHLLDITRYRARAFKYLLKEKNWQFATINFHLPDQAGHNFWDEFQNNPEENAIVEAYELCDEILGNIIDTIDTDTDTIVMSDHGHGPQKRTVNLNYFLLKEGFIQLKDSFFTKIKKQASEWGVTPDNVRKILENWNLTRLLPDLNREQRDRILDKFINYRDVDWEATEAYTFGHIGQVYWIGDDSDRLEELRASLEEFRIDGKPLISEIICLREDESDRSPSRDEPLWLLNMEDWATLDYPLFMGEWGFEQKPTGKGSHRPEGIIAWNGPRLSTRDSQIEANITDLAPTVHRLLKIPPQPDFDGDVIKSVLGDNIPEPLDPADYGESNKNQEDDDEERIEQLKNMGYL